MMAIRATSGIQSFVLRCDAYERTHAKTSVQVHVEVALLMSVGHREADDVVVARARRLLLAHFLPG